MKTNHKIIIDKLVGKSLLQITGLLKKKSTVHAENISPKKIVICKFLGMGSIIQSTSLVLTLKKNFPSAKIIFLSSKINTQLIKMIPDIDEMLTVDDRNIFTVLQSTLRIASYFKKEETDLYFDLEPHSFYSKLLCHFSNSKIKNGFIKDDAKNLPTVYTNEIPFHSGVSLQDSYLKMASLSSCKSIVEELYNFPSPHTQVDSDSVVINVNASDLRIERRWPAENYVALINMLTVEYPNLKFALTGSASETAYVNQIFERLTADKKSHVRLLAGKQTLAELFDLIRNCRMMITNDTGPMHIAFAFRKPTLALFGPASPFQYHCPPESIGIYEKISCSPCVHLSVEPPCKGDNQCMKQISVNQVIGTFRKMMPNRN